MIRAFFYDLLARLVEIELVLGSLSLEDAYFTARDYRERAEQLRQRHPVSPAKIREAIECIGFMILLAGILFYASIAGLLFGGTR